MKKLLFLSLLFYLISGSYLQLFADFYLTHKIDTLPDGRSLYDLSQEELKLFSNPQTRPFITGRQRGEIKLNIGERLYLLGSMLTVASPSLKMPTVTRTLPGLTKAETGITQNAKKIYYSEAFNKGIADMKAGKHSEVLIEDIKIVFQADGPFSGLTLFGENGFVIGKEALQSSDELLKTVLHECYRLATSGVKANPRLDQTRITMETQNVVNFVERAINSLNYD